MKKMKLLKLGMSHFKMTDSKLGKTIMEPSKYILLIPQFQAIYYTLDVEKKIRISSVKMNGQDL